MIHNSPTSEEGSLALRLFSNLVNHCRGDWALYVHAA